MMKQFQILETQKALEKLNYPTPLAIAKDIVEFTNGNEKKISEILKRISKNEPWEYIKGYTYFKNSKIFLNNDVLIPRIETEELVDIAVEEIKKIKESFQILDIGTGSGCIAIALSKKIKRKNFEIIATDVSKKALKIAKRNSKENNCNNIKIINADLLNFEFDVNKPTVIVSNLPYIPKKDLENLDPSVKNYEPISALDGGLKGDFFYKKLIAQIKEKNVNLKYGIFEIDPSFNVKKENYKVVKDSFGRKRFLIIPPFPLK